MQQFPTLSSFVEVRGRTWLVEGIREGSQKNTQIVDLACTDDDSQGTKLSAVWQAEISARVLDGNEWARVGTAASDDAGVFAAYLQTLRWNTVSSADRQLFQAPFRAGIKLEAYQLEPLRKALKLPRVNLLIADDVGLGKTIEAGLVVREMLLRRQLDFILVAAPPTMTIQWKDELEAKFGLTFEIIDREYLREVRSKRGFTANPWSVGSNFIISHALLRDETYTSGLRARLGEFSPRSMLILDEAHHAAPSGGGAYAIDSQFTKSLRDFVGAFEHRLFLSATPHNGHSNSFSALLEMLDPQRFTRGVDVKPSQRDAVMVRRLKEDLRRKGVRFPKRIVEPIAFDSLPIDTPELKLSRMLLAYGDLRNQRLAKLTKGRQTAARFVYSGLQQRLLSSSFAFAKTLKVHRDSLQRAIDRVEGEDLGSAKSFAKFDPESLLDRLDTSLDEVGAEKQAEEEEDRITAAATRSSVSHANREELLAELSAVEEMIAVADPVRNRADERVKWLANWAFTNMSNGKSWNDRRLVIFTEFEDTRRWLQNKLREELEDLGDVDEAIAHFSGTTSQDRREELKAAFNAPPDQTKLRILICTDAAREGINLQMRCHDLVHFDLPWNPSRLEQRNGRIDRKLQPSPEVTCRYFLYRQRPTDIVLDALVRKTEQIRLELGSLGKVIEDRIEDKLTGGGITSSNAETLREEIANDTGGEAVQRARRELEDQAQAASDDRLGRELEELRKALETSREKVGVQADDLQRVVGVALSRANAPLNTFTHAKVGDTTAIALDPSHKTFAQDKSWNRAFDDLRARPRKRKETFAEWRKSAPVRRIAFEPPEYLDGRFADDVVQVHLEHRLVRRLLSRFLSIGFQDDLSRVTVLRSHHAEPRVILLGRLSLYGEGAARLHEELIPVTALWRGPERTNRPIRPFAEKGEETTLQQLREALVDARPVSPDIEGRILAFVEDDLTALRTELEARARAARIENEQALTKIGQIEAAAMTRLLEDQIKAIQKTDTIQLSLNFSDAERTQQGNDQRHREAKLTKLQQDLVTEPARVEQVYQITASRLEPVGLVYLWPASG
jgi:Helicase conserved C-terminal domain/SNF2-related domain